MTGHGGTGQNEDETLLPVVPVAGMDSTEVSSALLYSRQATAAAWNRLEGEFGLLDSNAVKALLRATSAVSLVEMDRELLGVTRGGTTVYPGFQFASGTILIVIKQLLALARENEWSNEDLSLWLMGPNTSFEAEGRPVDHLVGEPEAVLASARDEFEALW
ncbi:hypothetical protein [Cryobacterium lyxosi]|uniref:Antitoxin Xre/MbcA/ParS-like toxin-binding domain-containing protein n=1 Tax=Cryobacterium lyxosi TaxID=1259228 RepID=A0A4R8ZI27_9MICO|nr:hypothetical protein [Cryobacterium lyxosi]TFD28666.1 hypothetical protein E3T27_01885 [Cryobacterium lyxosi]